MPKSSWRSSSSPRAHSTIASAGIMAATARASADLPTPASPSITTSCGAPTSAVGHRRGGLALLRRAPDERLLRSIARHPHGPTPLVNVILARTVPRSRRGSFREDGVPRLGDRADDG